MWGSSHKAQGLVEQATTIAAGVMPRPARRKDFLAAIMIMAAVGPGFITQTAIFTAKLGAAFAFAILGDHRFRRAAQYLARRHDHQDARLGLAADGGCASLLGDLVHGVSSSGRFSRS